MAKPGGAPENLVPQNRRTKEEQRRIAIEGGKKSGEVRREKKRMADIYAAVLAKKYNLTDDAGNPIEVDGADMIRGVIEQIVQRKDSASVSMIRELREGIDGSRVEHSGAVTILDDIPKGK